MWEKKLILDEKGDFVEDNRESILPYPEDEDGYLLCPFCKRILGRHQLSECPDCGRLYKGYKRYPKYNFPCPDCE